MSSSQALQFWTYVVQSGDDVVKIANMFGTDVPRLVTANNLNASSLIFVGQILVVPFPLPPPPPSISTGNTLFDKYDSLIQAESSLAVDPMVIKAQMYQESYFDNYAVSPDQPCGIPTGWGNVSITINGVTKTVNEASSFGLLQVTPACDEGRMLLLQNGHPNLTTDSTSPLWSFSVFNPEAAIKAGINAFLYNLTGVKAKFPGCTSEAIYYKMALAAYNSGPGAVSGCGVYNTRAVTYVNAVLAHYVTLSKLANYPNPLGL